MEGGSETPAREGTSSPVVLASEMVEETNDDARMQENGRGVEDEPEVNVNSSSPPLLREDQVQNAVNFLSHPKVKGSPVKFRRAFLEKKGLSQAEIDEAFRRVPDSSPSRESKGNEASGLSLQPGGEPAQTETTDGRTSTTTAWKRPSQPFPQARQQLASVARYAPGNLSRHLDERQQDANMQTVMDARPGSFTQKYSPPLSQSLIVPPRRGFRWTQMVLALGVLTAAGAGTAVVTRNYFLPRLKSWIRRIVADEGDEDGEYEQNRQKTKRPSPIEEAATAAAAAASAVTVMAKEMATLRADEQKHRDALLRALELQREDLSTVMTNLNEILKSSASVQMSAAEQTSGVDGSLTVKDLRKELLTFASVMREAAPAQSQDTSLARQDSVRADGQGTRSPPVYSVNHRDPPSSPAGSAVRQDVMRGDSQGAVRQESPPASPARPLASQSSTSLGGKDAECATQDEASSVQRRSQPLGAGPSSFHAPHPKSYMEVVEMLAKGQKPPGIKDIDDRPPNPDQPLSSSRMKPLPKPWERSPSPESMAVATAATNQKKSGMQYGRSLAAPGSAPSRPEGSYDATRDFSKASGAAGFNASASAIGAAATDRIPWWRPAPKISTSVNAASTVSSPLPISASSATSYSSVPQPLRPPSTGSPPVRRESSPSVSPQSSPPLSPMPQGYVGGRPSSSNASTAIPPSSAIPSPQAVTPPLQTKEVPVDRTPNEVKSSFMEPASHETEMAGDADTANHTNSIAVAGSSNSGEEIAVVFDSDLSARGKGAIPLDAQDMRPPKGAMDFASAVGALEPTPRSTWLPPPAPKPLLQNARAAMGYKVPIEEQITPAVALRRDGRSKEEITAAEVPRTENGQYPDDISSDGHPSIREEVVATRNSAGGSDLLTEIEI